MNYDFQEPNAHMEVLRALTPSAWAIFGLIAVVGVVLVLVARPGRRFVGGAVLGLGALYAVAVFIAGSVLRATSYNEALDGIHIFLAYFFALLALAFGFLLCLVIGMLVDAARSRSDDELPTTGKVVGKEHVEDRKWLMPAGMGVLIPMHTPESWNVTLRGNDGYEWTVETTAEAFSRVRIGDTFDTSGRQ